MKLFKKIFQRKPKALLLEGGIRVVPAFELKGEVYYMHEDPLNTATGRGLTAMVHMEELLMRCDVDYLKWHIEAIDKIFSDPKKTDLPALYKLHYNLKERVNFLVALPDHVLKLASVVFFTENESFYRYDHHANKKKIEEWKQTDGMYDFFLQTPLKILVPSLVLPESNSREYLEVVEKISRFHLKHLQENISELV